MKRKILCLLLLLAVMSSMIVIPNSVCAQESSITEAYKTVLSNHGTDTMSWETATGEQKTLDIYSKYALYDIDKDNSPELLVEDVVDCMLYIYSFKNNTITCWSRYVDAYTAGGYFEYPDGNGIIMHGGGMGYDHFEYVSKYVYADGELAFDNNIEGGYTLDGSAKELRDSLSGYKAIIFKEANDLSLFDNLNNTIKVVLNGEEIEFDQPPVIINNRVMVPMRKIFETLGYYVEWYGDAQVAVASKDSNEIVVELGENTILYGDETYFCDVAPTAVSGRTLVPVRAVSECDGCHVEWNAENYSVIITSK